MKGPARLLIVLVLPLLLGKALELFLSSGAGRKVTAKAGAAELSTREGIDLATKYASLGAGAVGATATALAGKTLPPTNATPNPRAPSYAAIAQDTAELLLATGALVKVVGDFLRDREMLRVKRLGRAPRG